MSPKGQRSIRKGHQFVRKGHQSVRNVSQGGGKAPKGVLRCFLWAKMFQRNPHSIARCSQQVTGCSQGAGMYVTGVQKVFSGRLMVFLITFMVLSRCYTVFQRCQMVPSGAKCSQKVPLGVSRCPQEETRRWQSVMTYNNT